jgi:tetratricopeptide (TPR) repeat protein
LFIVVGLLNVASMRTAGAEPEARDDTKEEALAAYQAGKQKMAVSDFDGALTAFLEADSLVPGPAPKYRIAVCYDELGRHDEALAAYQRFLGAEPPDKYAEEIANARERIAALTRPEVVPEPAHAEPEPIDAPRPWPSAPVLPEEPASPGRGLRIAGWIVLGVGLAATVIVTIEGVQALSAKAEFDQDPTVDNADEAEAHASAADVVLPVALGATATGIVLLAVGYTRAQSDQAIRMIPHGGPEGGGARVIVSF